MEGAKLGELAQAVDRAVIDPVRTISSVLHESGHRSWVVGGCVRDIALARMEGEAPKVVGDWDLCTDARPEQVQELFRKVIPTGIQHGTVTVVMKKQHFEITTLRGEKGHSDGRRPDEVYFVDDLREDLARRDFTVNAIAFDVHNKSLHDPFDGASDLRARLLRAVGEPARRFEEDGLRVLRLARFCSTLRFDIEPETRAAIVPSLDSFRGVARERVADEWFKALAGAAPSRFFRVLLDHEMLSITAPHLFSSDGTLLEFDEAIRRVDRAPRDAVLRLALFVRAGTETSRDPQEAARAVAKELRLSRERAMRLGILCRFALLPPPLLKDASGYEGRKWLAAVGRSAAKDVLSMQAHLDAQLASEKLEARHRQLLEQLDSGCPLSLKELAVSGKDLIECAGVEKGPALGRVLNRLLEASLRDPARNERDALLRLASDATLR